MKYLAILLLLYTNLCQAQDLQQRYSGITFTINGNVSASPFNGGHNNSKYQFIDIDNDGLKDLFMFDVDTTLYYYKNTGSALNPKFELQSTKFQNLYIKNWFYFVDIDNDADADLFTGSEAQTIKYFRNTGSVSNPIFTLMIDPLKSNTDSTISSESNCVPSFADIDNDGDKDFFIGTSIGAITFYKNIGNAASFSFQHITDLWEDILIISPADNERHGANAIDFSDFDGDNDYDVFFGDLFSAGVYYIKNNGTPFDAQMEIIDSTYPNSSPYLSNGFNMVRTADIDNDGDKDFFVSVLLSSMSSNNFAFYRNTGSAGNPNLQRITENFMVNVDVGDWSNFDFTDLDGDGKKDLLLTGNSNGSGGSPKLSFYKNTGTIYYPAFTLMQDSISVPVPVNNFRYSPSLADIDNDGDKDMLLGSFITDSVYLIKNTGTPQSFNFSNITRGTTIGLTGMGQYSTPVFVDIDNDNDFDIIAGNSGGTVRYYQNTGNASSYNFILSNNNYFNVSVGNESAPRFYDIDLDGDLDMFVGKRLGTISFYLNTGTASNANFVLQTANYKNINVSSNAVPVFVDIDTDTDGDLFIGNIKGGLWYYENRDVIGILPISSEIPRNFILHQNYPNPFNPSTKIKFEIPKRDFIKLEIYDTKGSLVSSLFTGELNAGVYEYEFNAENLSSGVYYYTLKGNNLNISKKMVVLK